MTPAVQQLIQDFQKDHQIQGWFEQVALSWFIPLAERLNYHQERAAQPMFIGINGCQGSGKSTLSDFLYRYLSEQHQLQVAVLSLDDFYFSQATRQQLSQDVHPLLRTRGVPGSHDVSLLKAVLEQLQQGKSCVLPRFDKATDNPKQTQFWPNITQAVDLVIVEGWCWGVTGQSPDELIPAINELEFSEDPTGTWRNYVNTALVEDYQPIYSMMDYWVMLKAPSFGCVSNWRKEQENKLRQSVEDNSAAADGVMTDEQVERFIQHYQRLTEQALAQLPASADLVLHLTPKRNIYACSGKDTGLLQSFAKQTDAITTTSRPLVFTDLDGTLLDHHSYSFAPAKATLAELANRQIPVIPTTSKTFSEIVELRHQAGLTGPFIAENGAAVFLPQNQWPQQPEGTEAYRGYWLKSFAKPRQHWLNLLSEVAAEHQSHYLGFSQMTTEQISAATGLAQDSAALANARLFSEPLQWLGTDTQKQSFKQKMQAAGAYVLQGGRFVHISDHCNKGLALNWLRHLYQTEQQGIYTIALGDSYNDIDMLETADIAVQIKTPKHPYPELQRPHNVWQSQQVGPNGWAECLTQILQLK